MTEEEARQFSINLLVLGGGSVTSEYHIPALSTLGQVEDSLVVEKSLSRVIYLRHKFPGLSVIDEDFSSFLTDFSDNNRLNAVIVALPNSFHEEAVSTCISKGMHVLCEKPLALHSEVCKKLAEEASVAQRKLAVGMVRRLLPSVLSVREALNQELIGEILSVDIEDGEKYAWSPSSDAPFRPENGGVLADMGIHYLDIIEYLIGKLTPLSYHDDIAGGVEANCQFQLKTEPGAPVRISLSRTHQLRNSMILHGDKGDLTLIKDTFDHCLWINKEKTLESRIWPSQAFHWGHWPPIFESCFLEQLCDFFAAIQGQNIPYVTGYEAASTVELIEWAHRNRKAKVQSPGMATEKIKAMQSSRMLSNASVFITGGTGFIGTRLAERLSESGFGKLKIPVRNFRNCAQIARFPVEMQKVNLLDYEQVCQAINGSTYVFHLAYGRDGTRSERVQMTIEGTKNIVEASIKTGAECVVVLSTINVFGNPDSDSEVDETWPQAPIGGEYGKSKAKMEKWCLKRARTSGKTRVVVLNPTCVYGIYGDTYTTLPLRMAKEGTFCWIHGGLGLANYTFIDNLVDAMTLAASCKEAHGSRFIINDGTTTWHEFLSPMLGAYADSLQSYTKDQLKALQPNAGIFDLVKMGLKVSTEDKDFVDLLKQNQLFRFALKAADRRIPRLSAKIRELRRPSALKSAGEELCSNGRIPPVWLADLFGQTSTVFSSAKAQRVLGWSPRIGLEEGQKLTQDWLHNIKLL
jgi:predicted dehydrogenase/nucleoside-diphosphate-sugar epimerase